MADRTRNRAVIEFAQRLVILTDWLFTGPAALVLGVSGFAAIFAGQLAWLETPWLIWGLVLFGVSGVLWMGVLIPVQIKQSRILAASRGEAIPAAYASLGRIWTGAGVAASVLPVIAIFVMVLKPV